MDSNARVLFDEHISIATAQLIKFNKIIINEGNYKNLVHLHAKIKVNNTTFQTFCSRHWSKARYCMMSYLINPIIDHLMLIVYITGNRNGLNWPIIKRLSKTTLVENIRSVSPKYRLYICSNRKLL